MTQQNEQDPPSETEEETPAAPETEATSPTLEHLDDTIKGARAAADQALAPQRE